MISKALNFGSFLSFVLCLGIAPPVAGEGNPPDSPQGRQLKFNVEKFKLANGLTVLVHEDPSLPILTYHQWFRVGSRDEKPGRTGLAHFFEHLMFKGTKKYPGDSFSSLVKANGGDLNAFTSKDYTGYFIKLPNSKLELAVDLESDRMINLLFDEKVIGSEREVVKEERRVRTEDSVGGAIWEAMFATLFKVHNYRWPVIGSMEDLNATSLEDLKNFYRTFYAPNNAVVVVAGDVRVKDVKSLVEKYYGKFASQVLPGKNFPGEPPQKGERTKSLSKSVQNPVVAVCFPAPTAGTDEAYSIELLGQLLGQGDSARLHRRLVYQEQLVSEVSVMALPMLDAGVFLLKGDLRPGVSQEKFLTSLYSELYKVRKDLVTTEEIEKVKNQALLGFIEGLKTTSGKAYQLAYYETHFGDFQRLFQDVEKYMAVTRESLRAVAQKYLAPEQRSVIQVVPLGGA